MAKNIKASELGDALGRDMLRFFQNLSSELANTAIDNAPADTGALKDSIRGGINQEVGGFNPNPSDTTGQAAKEYNKVMAGGIKMGDVFMVRASAPYAGYVENGTEKQAPNGFIKRTLESLDACMERAFDRGYNND